MSSKPITLLLRYVSCILITIFNNWSMKLDQLLLHFSLLDIFLFCDKFLPFVSFNGSFIIFGITIFLNL